MNKKMKNKTEFTRGSCKILENFKMSLTLSFEESFFKLRFAMLLETTRWCVGYFCTFFCLTFSTGNRFDSCVSLKIICKIISLIPTRTKNNRFHRRASESTLSFLTKSTKERLHKSHTTYRFFYNF